MHSYELSDFAERYGLSTGKLDAALKELPSLSESGPWLGGGSLRRLLLGGDCLASDLDFFFSNEEQATAFETELVARGASKASDNGAARTFTQQHGPRRLTIQSIRLRFYESAADLCDGFDFTICQTVYDGTTLTVGPYTLWDMARKRIAVHKITYGASSVRRLLKYASQGFTVCQGASAELLRQVAADPSSINSEVEYVD